MSKVAFFGPWIGEMGWELMTWQAWCREKSKEFDKSYACSFPDMAPLYTDFAEFIPHDHPNRCLNWHREEDLAKVSVEVPDDVTDKYTPPKKYEHTGGQFIKFGIPPRKNRIPIIIHARGIKRGGKNYPIDQWDCLVKLLKSNVTSAPEEIASVGTLNDHLIEGTKDLRGISLDKLMSYMAGAKCVIGQSSGVMHLASLCGTPHVIWGPDKKQFGGETLKQRYQKSWNPIKTPNSFIVHDEWKPDPVVITEQVKNLIAALQGVPRIVAEPPAQENDHVVRPTLPSELRDQLVKAASAGKYFITVTYHDGSKLCMWNITNNFNKGDLIPALEGITADVKRSNFPKADWEDEDCSILQWR